MGDSTRLELGPCSVRFGASGSEVDLGFTKGGVRVAVESPTIRLTVDQFGQVPMGEILVGRQVTVTVPFAETALSLFPAIIPGVSFVSGTGVTSGAKAILNTPIGLDLLNSVAQTLLLTKSLGNTESTDPADKFRFYKAAPTGRVEFSFDLENQRTYQAEFTCYPDANQNYAIGVWGVATASA